MKYTSHDKSLQICNASTMIKTLIFFTDNFFFFWRYESHLLCHPILFQTFRGGYVIVSQLSNQ